MKFNTDYKGQKCSTSFEASPRVHIEGHAMLCYVMLCYTFYAMLCYSTITHLYFSKVHILIGSYGLLYYFKQIDSMLP